MQEEKTAYHTGKIPGIPNFFLKFNHSIREALHLKCIQYQYRGLSKKFEDIVTVGNAIASVDQEVFT